MGTGNSCTILVFLANHINYFFHLISSFFCFDFAFVHLINMGKILNCLLSFSILILLPIISIFVVILELCNMLATHAGSVWLSDPYAFNFNRVHQFSITREWMHILWWQDATEINSLWQGHCIQSSNEEMRIQVKRCKSTARELVSNPRAL